MNYIYNHKKQKWIGKLLNNREKQSHEMLRERVLNLNPPTYRNDGSLVSDIDYIQSYPIIPIYFSPFIKNNNGRFGSPTVLHLEVGVTEVIFPLNELPDARRGSALSDLLKKKQS
jgi:hypothetical protein